MSDAVPFGAQLYEALKQRGQGAVITGRMNYADVQELKAADREQTAQMFRGSSYEIVQHIRNDSPDELAELFVGYAEDAATAAGAIVFVGAVWISG